MAPDPLAKTARAFGARYPDAPTSLLILVHPIKKASSYAAAPSHICFLSPWLGVTELFGVSQRNTTKSHVRAEKAITRVSRHRKMAAFLWNN